MSTSSLQVRVSVHMNFDYEADWEEASKLKLISQYHSEFKSNDFSLEFLPNYCQGDQPITILKTFNDLILCCGEKFDKSEGVYYICNLQTKQWVALPPTPPNSKRCVDVEFFCEPHYYADKDHQGRVILNSQFKFKVLRFLNSFSSEGITLQIFSSETVDDHFNQSLQRVKFPGMRFCRIPYHSMLHLSLRRRRLHVVQISIIDVADHPDYGVPVMFIWWLRESLAEFRLGFYDMKNRTLNLVSKTWCHASIPEYGFYEEAMWSDASKLVLPLWPTPIPQISQAAAQPCQD
ncbi:hypothetical protein L6164_036424 [Bauhinia variegata]|uniref:Uncharacterized protein n=1 Tax=Bauhinia variegata TaxID=167791 RepID=A0ACB9KGZ6_BAUVA|nr:hypothetical protein L6164_036424 [Bauhinia variegata]